MLSVEESAEAGNEKSESNGAAEIGSLKSPARSEGSGSPTSLIFSWRRMRAEDKEKGEEEDDDDYDEDPASPPLWKPGSISKPYCPMSWRAQEIARGRQELMKLYEGMPETAYELSLKDLVDQKSAMEKLQQEQGTSSNDPDETQSSKKGVNVNNNNPKKKKASRDGRKKNNQPTSFLLNIFVPSSLTTRQHGATAPSSWPSSPKSSKFVRQNSNQSYKNSSNQAGKARPHKYSLWSLLRIKPSKGSDVSHSNSFSKVSPRPYSGKDCHPDAAGMNSPMDPKLNNKNSRCFMCSGYAVFFKTYCQACGKLYCSNCVKEATEDTPEGRRCKATCVDSDRDLEPHMMGCWPVLSHNKKKSERGREHVKN